MALIFRGQVGSPLFVMRGEYGKRGSYSRDRTGMGKSRYPLVLISSIHSPNDRTLLFQGRHLSQFSVKGMKLTLLPV